MKRVGVYLRVSTEEQARIQDGSLVSQRQRIVEYVDGQNRRSANWGVVVDFYLEEGKSAKDMNRPEFQRMLQDVRTGRINLIVATELSRLSRSLRDFCEVWDLFKKHSTGFVTLREQFDTTTAAGEMMVFNLINFAQYERKQTAERISANWLSRAKRGLWNGGCVPLGFDRNPKNPGELIPSPIEAKTVREIFDIFLEVESVRKTCRELSRRGIFSKKFTNKHGREKGGGHFTVPSLFRILTNQSYIGLREFGQPSKESETVKASWSAIVDSEIFASVQTRLASNRNRFKPDEWKRYPYPLTELLICSECGKHLGGKSAHGKNKKHHYYGHPRQINSDGVTHLKRCRLERVRAERIEDILLVSLKKLLSTSGLIEHWLEVYAKGTNSEIPALEGRLKSLASDIDSKTRRVQNLVTRISELPSEIPADPFFAQIKELNASIAILKSTRAELQSKSVQFQLQSIDRNALVQKIERTIQSLEKTPVEKRRPLYANLIEFAELHPTKIRVGLYAPTTPVVTGEPDRLKATGTDGKGHSNLKGKEGTILPFAPATRGGSTSVTNGAPSQT
jgi:site-specific DNA recombinase